MPIKKTWLLRLPEIREELSAMKVPVVDRAIFERLFGVRRRRAIQLLHFFDGYQSGRTFLIDRLALIEQLAPLEASRCASCWGIGNRTANRRSNTSAISWGE